MPVSPDSAAIPRVSIAKLAKKAPDLAAKLAAVDADSAVGNGDGMADAFEVQTLPGPDVAAYCAAAKKLKGRFSDGDRAMGAAGLTIAAAGATAALAPIALPAVALVGLGITLGAVLKPFWTKEADA